MNESDMLNRLIYSQSAIICGFYSGYPTCCVQFFITKKLWMSDTEVRRYIEQIQHRSQQLGNKWGGYIPCPNCLKAGNMVEVLPCPSGKKCHPGDGQIYNGKAYLLTPE